MPWTLAPRLCRFKSYNINPSLKFFNQIKVGDGRRLQPIPSYCNLCLQDWNSRWNSTFHFKTLIPMASEIRRRHHDYNPIITFIGFKWCCHKKCPAACMCKSLPSNLFLLYLESSSDGTYFDKHFVYPVPVAAFQNHLGLVYSLGINWIWIGLKSTRLVTAIILCA